MSARWLAHPDGPPPTILDDIVVAAPRLSQNAVSEFGGDPTNVTIFGQSAGATLVGALLATSAATGFSSTPSCKAEAALALPRRNRRIVPPLQLQLQQPWA